MNDITLKQIEIFITVAESLSFSEAARELFIDQSVVVDGYSGSRPIWKLHCLSA